MSFSDIKGQARAISLLQGYIENKKLEGGYLFIGAEGIGKKLVAKTLAKVVNCQADSVDSCEKCPSCLKIEKNQHPDVFTIDASLPAQEGAKAPDSSANVIKIDHIRQLQRDINLRPYEGRSKVFIIDDAHNLTAEASNALLKILEEPPRNSLIILTTSKPELLFKTVVSRCKVIRFYPAKRPELEEIFESDYKLEKDKAHFLAYFSEGRIGRALSLKETGIFVERDKAVDKFVFTAKPDFENVLAQKKECIENYLNILAAWFRDVYLIKAGLPSVEIINLDRKQDLLKLKDKFTFADLDRVLNSISDSVLSLEQNMNPKLVLYNLGAQLWKA
ncbi:MAG: AAA family ATPase [Candidatus Omnitrophica bacterium]|nr:AAA family ATPase [Candidatus Omnitrophota bacterium]